MADTDPFVESLLDLLAPLGEVHARRMFGGWGFFKDELMFALVAEGVFYLKCDEENAPQFEEHALSPFTHRSRNGKTVTTSYRRCPEEALARPSALRPWAESACSAARRAAASKPRRPARKSRSSSQPNRT